MSLDLIALRGLIGLSWRRYFANFAPATLASIVMVLAIAGIMQLRMPDVAMLIVSVASGAVVYLVSLYLIAPSLARELWSKLRLIFDRRPAS